MSTLISNTIKPESGDTVTFTDSVSIGGTLTYEDVNNVDSVGIVTARSGIKVGAGESISPVSGTLTYYGDGSNLTGIEFGVVDFVASGTIDNGATVIIKDDGTVGIITQTTSDTPTVGISSVWSSASVYYVTSTYDTTNNKIVIAYVDNDDSNKGKAIVGTVTGVGITFGAPVTFNGGNWSTDWTKIVYDPDQDKIVIAYIDATNSSYGTAIVGQVVGDTTTFGAEVVFKNATINAPAITYDTTNDKIVIAFKDQGNNNYGTAVVGTVVGTGITFTGPDGVFANISAEDISATFDHDNGKVVIAYQQHDGSYTGRAVVGTVDPSNDSIGFGTPVVFNGGNAQYMSAIYDSDNSKVVIAYQDDDSTRDGTAVVVSPTSQTTNLTAENYIGISGEAISNAATGKVNVIGGVNSGQSGLTTAQTYYVQGDGTLATTADTPSVIAGTSISDTEIVIKY